MFGGFRAAQISYNFSLKLSSSDAMGKLRCCRADKSSSLQGTRVSRHLHHLHVTPHSSSSKISNLKVVREALAKLSRAARHRKSRQPHLLIKPSSRRRPIYKTLPEQTHSVMHKSYGRPLGKAENRVDTRARIDHIRGGEQRARIAYSHFVRPCLISSRHRAFSLSYALVSPAWRVGLSGQFFLFARLRLKISFCWLVRECRDAVALYCIYCTSSYREWW